ncbi:hypothetical protein EDC01DRAFT_636283 [Geopyxis carbonaria]|nr:hypothetical protein EDC01DRAFT_636283 [Geopyxis carbonaria]
MQTLTSVDLPGSIQLPTVIRFRRWPTKESQLNPDYESHYGTIWPWTKYEDLEVICKSKAKEYILPSENLALAGFQCEEAEDPSICKYARDEIQWTGFCSIVQKLVRERLEKSQSKPIIQISVWYVPQHKLSDVWRQWANFPELWRGVTKDLSFDPAAAVSKPASYQFFQSLTRWKAPSPPTRSFIPELQPTNAIPWIEGEIRRLDEQWPKIEGQQHTDWRRPYCVDSIEFGSVVSDGAISWDTQLMYLRRRGESEDENNEPILSYAPREPVQLNGTNTLEYLQSIDDPWTRDEPSTIIDMWLDTQLGIKYDQVPSDHIAYPFTWPVDLPKNAK